MKNGRSTVSMCACAHVRMCACAPVLGGLKNVMATWSHAHMATCLLLLLPLFSAAQTVGRLRFSIDPPTGYEFVLDHKYRMAQQEVELSAGPHHFSFWAPQRMVMDTTLIVMENSIRDVRLRLPFSNDYRFYEQAVRTDRKKVWTGVVLPSVLTAGAVALTAGSFVGYKRAHDRLRDDEADYINGSDPAALAGLKSEIIPRHKDEFREKRGFFYASVGVCTVVAAGSAWLIARHTKRDRPRFFDSEKVKFDGLVWMPSGDDAGMWMAGLHFDIR